MTCQICRVLDGTPTTRATNGLPADVVICVPCRQAVSAKQVGVSRRADGTLFVVDARLPWEDAEP